MTIQNDCSYTRFTVVGSEFSGTDCIAVLQDNKHRRLRRMLAEDVFRTPRIIRGLNSPDLREICRLYCNTGGNEASVTGGA